MKGKCSTTEILIMTMMYSWCRILHKVAWRCIFTTMQKPNTFPREHSSNVVKLSISNTFRYCYWSDEHVKPYNKVSWMMTRPVHAKYLSRCNGGSILYILFGSISYENVFLFLSNALYSFRWLRVSPTLLLYWLIARKYASIVLPSFLH